MYLEILSDPESEYNKGYEEYKREYESRTNGIEFHDIEQESIQENDFEFIERSKGSLDRLKGLLVNEITRCNKEKIFFFGCNFSNYTHNYDNRLISFLNKYDDSSEIDFLNDEIKFYENALKEINDFFTKHTIGFIKLSDWYLNSYNYSHIYFKKIVDTIGFKQFVLSTNRILDFLEKKKRTLNLNSTTSYSESENNSNNQTVIIESEIECIDSIYFENKAILPTSISKAYKEIGEFKTITFYQDEEDDFSFIYDLGPFDNVPGEIIFECYCLDQNYHELESKIIDKTYIFFDNSPLKSYLYEYVKGFHKGYHEFEFNLENKQKAFDDSQEQKALKIFNFVLNAKYKNGYFGDIVDSYENFKGTKGIYVSYEDFSVWGFKGGQFYKAWEIILNNPIVFEPIFVKYYNSNNTNDEVKTEITVYKSLKKYPAKSHALLYMLELIVKNEEPPVDTDGAFIKTIIVKIGKMRCQDTGQSFYKYVQSNYKDVKQKNIKKFIFGKNWKRDISMLSNNNKDILKFIEDISC